MFLQYREYTNCWCSLALDISTTLFISYNALSNLLKPLIKGIQGQTWNGPFANSHMVQICHAEEQVTHRDIKQKKFINTWLDEFIFFRMSPKCNLLYSIVDFVSDC